MSKSTKIVGTAEAWENGELGQDVKHAQKADQHLQNQIDNAIDDEYTSCPYCNGEPQPTFCSECSGTGKALLFRVV